MVPVSQYFCRSQGRRGFTLIELLVVISIIALLIAILLPGLGRARATASLVRDESTARQLMAGYLEYASANQDQLMVGYRAGLGAQDEFGQPIALQQYSTAAATGRYPWRLAPYLDYTFGAFVTDADALDRLRNLSRDEFIYALSEGPRFGLNTTFLGGDSNEYGFDPAANSTWGPNWVVRRATNASRPSDLITFATATRQHDFTSISTGQVIAHDGFFRVRSPYFLERRWAEAPPEERDARTRSATVGNVHFATLGKAVVAALDGHAEALDWGQMQDMRRWSDQADRPDWTLPLPGQ